MTTKRSLKKRLNNSNSNTKSETIVLNESRLNTKIITPDDKVNYSRSLQTFNKHKATGQSCNVHRNNIIAPFTSNRDVARRKLE